MARLSEKKKTNSSDGMAEVVFADSSSKADYRRRKRAVEAGALRKIAPKIFSTNLTDSPAAIIRRNWRPILGHLYPGAVVSHRTACEMKPTDDGKVHLTYTYTKKRHLPGLTVYLVKGPGKKEDDMPLPGGLVLSSEARKALENLEGHTRSTGRTIALEDFERWLEALLNARGENGLNALRDRAREIAPRRWLREWKKLDAIIGALLRTKPAGVLISEAGRRRSRGEPYDRGRDRLFDSLFTHLLRAPSPSQLARSQTSAQREAFAFFESYFSNFIEGTEFEISEAKEIVFARKIPTTRSRDGHDILSLYLLAMAPKEMKRVPNSGPEFIGLLRERHQKMLSARPEKRPGQFKEQPNRAGETHFVEPALVQGTLLKGFEYYQSLPCGFSRAAFMMFLVAEVHPFDDGNGRLARLMMNAELSNANTHRLLVPIVYRTDYLTTLRRLSRQSEPSVYLKMLEKLYRFSGLLTYAQADGLEAQLIDCNAFKEPEDNVLRMPQS